VKKEARCIIDIPCCASYKSKCCLNISALPVRHCNMQDGNEFHASVIQ